MPLDPTVDVDTQDQSVPQGQENLARLKRKRNMANIVHNRSLPLNTLCSNPPLASTY